MWRGQDKVWLHYTRDIMAADAIEAAFFVHYLRHCGIHRLYLPALEVIDLQRYKIIKKAAKVQSALYDRLHIPFIFVAGKN